MLANPFRLGVALLAAAVTSTGCSGNMAPAANAAQPMAAAAAAASPAPATAANTVQLPDFVSLVERYGPAVVNVTVVGKTRPVADFGLDEDDPFYEFFRRFGRPLPRDDYPPPRGEGSGFIVSSDGYILTNAHVVENAEEVTVKTTDRREYTAKVVGLDERTDVAVLKIEAKNLPTVRIGDPSKLRPGEWVIAVGSPFGLENTVTAGIVSATSRSMPDGSNNFAPFIQTDVAVNPGNSGGPLFNMNGEVVGINSQIYSRTGGYMGLSFAIPIDIANHVKEQLIQHGKVIRSRIGVTIQEVNAQLAESFGLDRPRGALVGMVEDGAPGAKAGLKPGDVILEIDGDKIETSSQVPVIIANKTPGSEVKLRVWRDGRVKQLAVRPEEMDDGGQRLASNDDESGDEAERLGLAVRPLRPEEKRRADTEGDLLVEDVEGPALAAGVRPGDIILGVNGTRVRSVEELRRAAKKRDGKVVALFIQRADAQIFLPVRVG
ncbi:MAG TPA: DegQ family serine endoprotease [Steroidobacteraceae bacterium]